MTLENIKTALNITDAQIEEFETVTTLINKYSKTNDVTIEEYNELMHNYESKYFTCKTDVDCGCKIELLEKFYIAEYVCLFVKNFKDNTEDENIEELEHLNKIINTGVNYTTDTTELLCGYNEIAEDGNYFLQADLEKAIKTYEKQNNCTVLEYTVKEANTNNYTLSDVLAEELEEYEEFTIETLTLAK